MLRLAQEVDDVALTNVHSEFYEILDMTGFTDIVKVRLTLRI